MSFAAIYLNPEDDVVSIRDRLDWAREGRVVLVLPDSAEGGPLVLEHALELELVRRHADDLRLQLGIVAPSAARRRRARAAGIPAFRTLRQAERRGRWRSRRSRAPAPSRPVPPGDRAEASRRLAPHPSWRRWLRRYLSLTIFILVTAVLVIGLAYAVPSATVVLRPQTQAIAATRLVVADPSLSTVDARGASTPGRRLRVVESWLATVETTGTSEVPDAPARGLVVFANQLSQPVTVPAGTRVSTSSGRRVVYQVLESIAVPGAIGATVAADVIAVEPGPAGNAEVGAVNRLEGPLANQLQVRNLEPLTGGATRVARTVTQADMDRLRAQVVQQLHVLAEAEMGDSLEPGEFLARDSLRISRVLGETYSHFAGEQTSRLSLEIRAELAATAVDERQAVGLVYEALVAAVPPGHSLVPDSLRFSAGEVLGVDGEGRVSFEMTGRGAVATDLNLDPALPAIAGQEIPLATTYLAQQLPLRATPEIAVFPPGFPRVPYLPSRIRVDVRLDY